MNARRLRKILGVNGLLLVALAVALFPAASALQANIGGQLVSGTFNMSASAAYVLMPDGASIYAWGYGAGGFMQLPGPTMIVNQGTAVTINLTNNLPAAAGNTSIVFPGLQVTTAGGVPGLVTQEAQHGGSVSYTFTASKPGTYLYHSGTRTDLQVEMGLYGAIIVRPTTVPGTCSSTAPDDGAAYNHPGTCFDREYLFLLSELQSGIHKVVEQQAQGAGPINVRTEPYTPDYWMINGRGAPDTMEPRYSGSLPRQPYEAMAYMKPGEKVLLRVVGAGRQMHPFHTHGNHVRVVARDGNLLGSSSLPAAVLENKLEFSVPSHPGQTVDGIFEWTGKDLGWDAYGHVSGDGSACSPDANGYHSVAADDNYREWCADHTKAIPVALPATTVLENGGFYAGSPFLGGMIGLPPGQGGLNPNAGFVFMWHSHTEKELTSGNVFPAGMMTMLIVEPPTADIIEGIQ